MESSRPLKMRSLREVFLSKIMAPDGDPISSEWVVNAVAGTLSLAVYMPARRLLESALFTYVYLCTVNICDIFVYIYICIYKYINT